jgi:hypothetical protein
MAMEAAQQAPTAQMQPMGDDAALIPQIMEVLRNPFVSEQDRAFLQQRLADIQKKQDPAYALDLEYKRAQINDLNKTDGGPGAEYGLQPIVTQEGPNDPNPGKYHLFQANKGGGKGKEIELPYNWTPKMQFLNTETGFNPVATQGVLQPGQGPDPIPINNAQSAADTAVGKDAGEAAALYSSLSSKMPGLQQVIGELNTLADEATYTTAGQLYNYGRKELGMAPTESAVARAKYVAMVDNQVLPMLRDTFGSQFTVVEGETLRATLGDPNKTPEEKKAVLNAFIQQKVRNIEAAAKQGNVKLAPQVEEEYDADGNRVN